MFESIFKASILFGFVLGPIFFAITTLYRKRVTRVIMDWKKPKLALFTILAFVVNLALFVLTCFFFAAYLGRLENIRIIDVPAQAMQRLATSSFVLMVGVTFLYLGIQNLFTQFIVMEGVLLQSFSWRRFRLVQRLISWDEIKDYYIKSDYPVTNFYLITPNSQGQYDRTLLRVPFYALPRFEALMDSNLKKQQELRDNTRSTLRRIPRN
jgi:hypothetical protein